jgi:hypothetical protein
LNKRETTAPELEKRTNRRGFIQYGLAAAGVAFAGGIGYWYYRDYAPKRCEACGMEIMTASEEHFQIRDQLTEEQLYACCQGCALKLADPERGHKEFTIETYCDYFGPEKKITINVRDYGNSVTVTPTTARLLLGAKVVKSCANNRFAYNQEAVDGLLKNGFSKYTMMWQQHPLPQGTPVMEIPKATPTLAKGGITYVEPSLILPAIVGVAGALTLGGSLLAYRKLTKKPLAPGAQE